MRVRYRGQALVVQKTGESVLALHNVSTPCYLLHESGKAYRWTRVRTAIREGGTRAEALAKGRVEEFMPLGEFMGDGRPHLYQSPLDRVCRLTR